MGVAQRVPVAERSNRVHWFTGRVHQVLDEVTAGGVCVATLSATETGEALVELDRALARLHGLKLALLAHAEQVAVATEAGAVPATSTAAWLAHATVTPGPGAHRQVRLAARLAQGFALTAQGLVHGYLDPEQAQVIVEAVDALPTWVADEDRARAEKHLLIEATSHDARALRLLGRHLLHVLDPEAADAELARRLAAEEAAAARTTMLTLREDGHGACHGRFTIPARHGAMLRTALNAIASPKRPEAIDRERPAASEDPEDPEAPGGAGGPVGGRVARPGPEVLGEALCQYLERYPADRLPTQGGVNATVVVTMGLETLLGGLTAATLDTGQPISAGQARRLACEAGIIPAVLGTGSELLDLGRTARFHTPAQRTAIRIRDHRCTATGCTVPAAWCQVHHKTRWADGGHTNLTDATTLCPRHHSLVHHPDYTTEYLPDGATRITRTRRRRQ